MDRYYKLTPAQAALISKFNYSSFEAIDPFVGEQTDGYFLINHKLYLDLVNKCPELRRFDISACPLVLKQNLNPKPSPIKP